MTVLEAMTVASWGGTFSEWSIARDRSDRGDLRRPDSGGQRWAGGAGGIDGPAGSGSAGQPVGAAGGPGWWVPAGPQGADVGGHDPGWWQPHRSRRRAA